MASETTNATDPRNGKPIVHKIVLTGGPCGGKTTGQARLSSFFEELGWKVFRVPEAACTLMSGGVKWVELSAAQADSFQDNLILTMVQMEDTFFELAESFTDRNCLVICDRGVFDATAYMTKEAWDKLKRRKKWNDVEMRDKRYNQVIHMVSAACGAEDFYSCDAHATRYETIPVARELDEKASKAWVGHPYFDVIGNDTDFENKLRRMINAVCHRVGLDFDDRLDDNSRKRKFLLLKTPDIQDFPVDFRDFVVVHDYLVTPSADAQQIRIRRRGHNVERKSTDGKWNYDTGVWTYNHTVRRREINHQRVEVKMQLGRRDYEVLLNQHCDKHVAVYKTRRCFLWHNQYFQMDMYQEPCHPRVRGLILLETYTSQKGKVTTPPFLGPVMEVSDDSRYSMYYLSFKDEYLPSEHEQNFVVTSSEHVFNGCVEPRKSTPV